MSMFSFRSMLVALNYDEEKICKYDHPLFAYTVMEQCHVNGNMPDSEKLFEKSKEANFERFFDVEKFCNFVLCISPFFTSFANVKEIEKVCERIRKICFENLLNRGERKIGIPAIFNVSDMDIEGWTEEKERELLENGDYFVKIQFINEKDILVKDVFVEEYPPQYVIVPARLRESCVPKVEFSRCKEVKVKMLKSTYDNGSGYVESNIEDYVNNNGGLEECSDGCFYDEEDDGAPKNVKDAFDEHYDEDYSVEFLGFGTPIETGNCEELVDFDYAYEEE